MTETVLPVEKPVLVESASSFSPSHFSLLWLALSLVTVIYTGATVVPFLTNLAGWGTAPGIALTSIGIGGLGLLTWTGWELFRGRRSLNLEFGGLLVSGLAFVVTLLYCLNQAGPFHNLPVGVTADSVHHYTLADYIQTYHALPLNASAAEHARLVEMVTYPPAYHLSAALFSETSGINLAYILFPVVALLMALCHAATAAVAYTLLRPSFLRPVLALAAAGSAYLAYGFFFDTFMYWDFYGQVAGQTALALGFYFALHYYKTGYWLSLLLGGLAGSVLILAYTHWLPMLGLALVAATLAQPARTWRSRIISTAAIGAWLLLIAGLFLKDRLTGVVWSGGAGADVIIKEDSLVWGPVFLVLLGGFVAAITFWQRKLVRHFSKWIWLSYGLVLLIVGGFILYTVGHDLAQGSPPRLYPFDSLTLLLTLGAVAGSVLALWRDSLSRFYLVFLAGLILEIIGYLVVKPGGNANAYHLSKLYTVGFVILLPVLAGLALQFLFEVVPSWLVKILPFKQPAAPAWLKYSAAFAGFVLCLPLALFFSNQLTSNSPARPYITVDPAIVDLTQQIRTNKLDGSKVELSVREGIPAYFTYVGLLDQPRNAQATDYYSGRRTSFESWLYDPQAQPFLLTDQLDAIQQQYPADPRFKVVYQQGQKVGLLTHTDNYIQALVEQQALFLSFEGQLDNGVVTTNLTVAGASSSLQDLQPAIVIGPLQDNAAPLLTQPLVSRALTLTTSTDPYSLQKSYLKFRLDDGYDRGAVGDQDLGPQAFKLAPGQYSAWVQWWKHGQPVAQRKVQDFDYAPGKLIALAPPGTTEPALTDRSGQLLLETPSLPASSNLTTANTFFQTGDTRLIELTGWEVEPGYRAGGTLEIRQRYLPVADLPTGYINFVHLLDSNGAVVAQSDFEPANGLYPTWLWHPNTPVEFTQSMSLPANLPPGTYSLEWGFYANPGQKRLETWFYEPYVNRIWENRFYAKDAVVLK